MDIVVPLIKSGPNAGKPRQLNEVLLSRISAVRDVLIKVRNSGYLATDIRLDGVRPSIVLEYHDDFSRLVDEGVACYYIWQSDPRGVPERLGQFHVDGVRLIWRERGH